MLNLLPRHFVLLLAATFATATAACSLVTSDDGGGGGSGAGATGDDAGAAGGDDDAGGHAKGDGGSHGGQDGGTGNDGGPGCVGASAPGAGDPMAVLDDGVDFRPLTAVTDGDGRAIAIGWATDDGSASPWLFAARVAKGGTFDPTYGTNGSKGYVDVDLEDDTNDIPGVVRAAVDAHGRLLVLYRRATVVSSTVSTELELVRLDATGHLDATFGTAGRVRGIKDPGETAAHGAALAVEGDTAYVFESIERTDMFLSPPVSVLRGLRITAAGAIDSSYGFEGNTGSLGEAGAVSFGGGIYLSNGDRLWKLTTQGNIDPTFGTAGYVDGLGTPSAVRPDGTTLFAGSEIEELGPSGLSSLAPFSDTSGGTVQVRCGGEVVAATVSTSDGTVSATLLATNGHADPSRGNGGKVSRNVDKSQVLLSSGLVPTTIDPVSATVTTFSSKHASTQSLVALRVHP